jgi:hypothetical protein
MEKNEFANEQINFDTLLKQGYAVIDTRYMNYEICPNSNIKYVIIRVSNRDSFYQEMLKQYFGVEVKEKDLYSLWQNVLEHKLKMSSVLGRDVSIKVAALDYYNIFGV